MFYMKTLKKIAQIVIISSITIVPCFSYEYTFDTQCIYLIWWDENLFEPYKYDLAYTYTDSEKANVLSLTNHFCQNVHQMKCSDSRDGEYSVDYFDASQSVFLSVLCNTVWENIDEAWTWILHYYNENDNYLKKKDFFDFNIVPETWYLEPCHPRWKMNNCDYSHKLPSIFNEIMDDFFAIKQARNFWINNLKDSFVADDAANLFSIGAFPWLELQPWLEKGICDPASKYYKTTCKTLKGYMTDARNLLKNTQVINVEGLDDREWVDCENYFKNNILYCGLLWSKSDYKFINTVYNEYLWYNLFLSYYSFYIDGPDYLDETPTKYNDRLEENKEKIFLVQDQLLKSKKAITTSLKSLSEITYSFPLHVWFLMYQEDAKLFMENISKIYAPIRTLYDKLRNVQIKEE